MEHLRSADLMETGKRVPGELDISGPEPGSWEDLLCPPRPGWWGLQPPLQCCLHRTQPWRGPPHRPARTSGSEWRHSDNHVQKKDDGSKEAFGIYRRKTKDSMSVCAGNCEGFVNCILYSPKSLIDLIFYMTPAMEECQPYFPLCEFEEAAKSHLLEFSIQTHVLIRYSGHIMQAGAYWLWR